MRKKGRKLGRENEEKKLNMNKDRYISGDKRTKTEAHKSVYGRIDIQKERKV